MKTQMPLAGLFALVVLTSAGCSTAPSKESGQPPDQPYYERSRMMIDDADAPLEINDPWEGMNKSIYRFNSKVDRYALNPAVSAYRFIFPEFIRKGVSNFFTNLDNLQTVINEIFQLRPVAAIQTTGRLVVNTTIGIVGLFDVATPMHIPQNYEDFGQTLGWWGVPPGPYLVLPLFGPSFVRDASGRVVDAEIFGWIDPLQLNDSTTRTYIYYTFLVLNTRSTTSFQYYQTGSPFEYELVRLLWSTKRKLEIEK